MSDDYKKLHATYKGENPRERLVYKGKSREIDAIGTGLCKVFLFHENAHFWGDELVQHVHAILRSLDNQKQLMLTLC